MLTTFECVCEDMMISSVKLGLLAILVVALLPPPGTSHAADLCAGLDFSHCLSTPGCIMDENDCVTVDDPCAADWAATDTREDC